MAFCSISSVGWVGGWFVGWFVLSLVGWIIEPLVDIFFVGYEDYLICLLVGWFVNGWVEWSLIWLTDWLSGRFDDDRSLVDGRLVGRLVSRIHGERWFCGQLVGWLVWSSWLLVRLLVSCLLNYIRRLLGCWLMLITWWLIQDASLFIGLVFSRLVGYCVAWWIIWIVDWWVG